MERPKLFVRERGEMGPGAKKPRFVFVASVGTDLRIKAKHVRKREAEQIAEYIGGEVIYLKGNKGDEDDDDEEDDEDNDGD